jgi:hypothetical protein
MAGWGRLGGVSVTLTSLGGLLDAATRGQPTPGQLFYLRS